MSALSDKEVNTREFFDAAETELVGSLGDIPEGMETDGQAVVDSPGEHGELAMVFVDDGGELLKATTYL